MTDSREAFEAWVNRMVESHDGRLPPFPVHAAWHARDAEVAALQDRVRVLEEALRNADRALRVPAAEYVPAIGDAFTIIDQALAKEGGRADRGLEREASALSDEEKAEAVVQVAAGLLACKIPDGYDRNSSHSTGTYQEYEWSLRTYLRPQDEWKATNLAEQALAALLERFELRRRP